MIDPMSIDDPARRDSRTAGELISAALCEPEDQAWQAIVSLHWRGTSEVLARATELCQSLCAVERRVGADILGQLGVPERKFPHECTTVLLRMLDCDECDVDVLQAIFVAFSHLHRPQVIPVSCSYVSHADPQVRHAIVFALSGHEDQSAIESLIQLTSDADANVRDWATFALGTQIPSDTAAIREALVARLTDADDYTRGEALRGLALRHDARLVPALAQELTAPCSDDSLAQEAVQILEGTELHSQLQSLLQRL